MFVPTEKDITILTDGSGVAGISVAPHREFGNGTELKLNALNMLGVGLKEVEFTITIFDNDATKGETDVIAIAEQNFSFPLLDVGTQHTKAIRIPKVKPSDIIVSPDPLQVDYGI